MASIGFVVDSDIFEGFGDLLFAFQAAKICQKCNIKWHGKEAMMHIIEELYVIPHKQLLHEGPIDKSLLESWGTTFLPD